MHLGLGVAHGDPQPTASIAGRSLWPSPTIITSAIATPRSAATAATPAALETPDRTTETNAAPGMAGDVAPEASSQAGDAGEGRGRVGERHDELDPHDRIGQVGAGAAPERQVEQAGVADGERVVGVDHVVVPRVGLEHPAVGVGHRLAPRHVVVGQRLDADLTRDGVPAGRTGVEHVPPVGVEALSAEESCRVPVLTLAIRN